MISWLKSSVVHFTSCPCRSSEANAVGNKWIPVVSSWISPSRGTPSLVAESARCCFMLRSMSSCTSEDRSLWSRSTKTTFGWIFVTRRCFIANMQISRRSWSCRETSPLWLMITTWEQAIASRVIWPSKTCPLDSMDSSPSLSSTNKDRPSGAFMREAYKPTVHRPALVANPHPKRKFINVLFAEDCAPITLTTYIPWAVSGLSPKDFRTSRTKDPASCNGSPLSKWIGLPRLMHSP
mmetsp:Transcript_45294/g.119601  ORF Transcript_45294/g.119601 Transcript_45294/m.119601 type:complete len:237 (+) Transcript_45294:147-857(+)